MEEKLQDNCVKELVKSLEDDKRQPSQLLEPCESRMHFAVLKRIQGEMEFQKFMGYNDFVDWISDKQTVTPAPLLWAKAPPMIGSRQEFIVDMVARTREGKYGNGEVYMFICLGKGDRGWEKFYKKSSGSKDA